MKFYALPLFLSLMAVFSAPAMSEETSDSAEKKVVEQPAKVDTESKEADDSKQEQDTDANEDSEEAKPEKKAFLTPEAVAKQQIADNNYSLSFFTERMDLELEQLDKAKKFSEEDKMKRESLLKSIYMLRDQSRDLEQESLDKFKSLLTPEQLKVFEELRAEQLKYRANYDVLAGNVKQQVERERKVIELDNKQLEEEQKKAEEQKQFEEETRRQEEEDIKHGRWLMFRK